MTYTQPWWPNLRICRAITLPAYVSLKWKGRWLWCICFYYLMLNHNESVDLWEIFSPPVKNLLAREVQISALLEKLFRPYLCVYKKLFVGKFNSHFMPCQTSTPFRVRFSHVLGFYKMWFKQISPGQKDPLEDICNIWNCGSKNAQSWTYSLSLGLCHVYRSGQNNA